MKDYDTTMGRCWGEKHPPMSKLIRFRPLTLISWKIFIWRVSNESEDTKPRTAEKGEQTSRKRATAFALAGLMATSGISCRREHLHMGRKITPCLHLQAQKAVEDLQPADEDMMCMSLQHWRITEKVKHR